MRNFLRPLSWRRIAGPPNQPPAGAYRSASYLPLRPWQVRSRAFARCRRGLDPVEVAAFLDRVAGDLAAAYAEVARSRDETARIKDALREWQSRQAPTARDLARRS
ncbi:MULTISPECIES: DivIVA domain-containing protein [Micromonospora]|uniref:DivIVA domain-containing protein n=1 Tax=Micromonospora solifontis TaxID=2487138 RepID=A0ABX9WBY7_9ACTN|nr:MULTISPECIES: DivIVA domain-containing protein [Micromonospora]NES14476.1 DivIVA domain-containing protein [Micromonospora sp. PPF5-17B]NES38490.1 DivIVA domain-containing protein [Micromonospora solifontis]NES56407.1 DivIVA domain-containing protein [Micromonospora sp. PPF5-6]RNL95309.1 DivIVA domain-containing protein [Micromonospora solifontis]